MNWFKLLFLCIVSGCSAFDENIRIAHLEECEEVFLRSEVIDNIYRIDCLWNNKINDNEILHMKLFVLGQDTHVLLSQGGNFQNKYYEIFISGNGGDPKKPTRSGIAEVDSNWSTLVDVLTTDLTDMFFYTQLLLVVTKGKKGFAVSSFFATS